MDEIQILVRTVFSLCMVGILGTLGPQMAGLPIPKLLGSLISDLIRSRYAYKIAVGVHLVMLGFLL